ncbi:hypothetical protein FUAX_39960 (plasmid) [Fulvitalea axinellae]|uniref:TolC family protein n=1 Tax=Fulvitalea axinellae TaxID=1182444 RepID=A0AAU9CHA0_9BACT|nr:hypothetical protein FUAX_39960 [Fulvitalea axinellae]
MKLRYGIFCAVFLFPFALSAQKGTRAPMSLEDCVALAMQKDVRAINAKLNTEMGRLDYRQSKLNLLPSVNPSIGAGYSFGKTINPTTNEFETKRYGSGSVGASASVPVFNGFRKFRSISLSRLTYRRGKLSERQTRYSVAEQVTRLFFDVLYQEEYLSLSQWRMEQSELNRKTVEKKVKLGLMAESEMSEALAQWEEANLTVFRAEQSLEEKRRSLNRILDMEPEEKLNLKKPEDDPAQASIPDPEALFDTYGNTLADARISTLDLETAKKELTASWMSLLPNLSFSASYSSNFSDKRLNENGNTMGILTQMDHNAGQSIRLSMGVPLFSAGSRYTSLRKNRLRVIRAENTLKDTDRSEREALAKYCRTIKRSVAEFELNRRRVMVAELAFKTASKKYERGLADLYELQATRNRLAQARLDLVRNRFDYWQGTRTLDYYLYGVLE